MIHRAGFTANRRLQMLFSVSVSVVIGLLSLVLVGSLSSNTVVQAQTIPAPSFIIIVDPIAGNDTACLTAIAMAGRSLPIPPYPTCQSLTTAWNAINVTNTWIQLLPGVHYASNLIHQFDGLTISSQLPMSADPYNLNLATNRIPGAKYNSSALVIWDCLYQSYCILSQKAALTISSIQFRNVSLHAIYQDALSSLPIPLTHVDLIVQNVHFNGTGALLYKYGGNLTMSYVTAENMRTNSNDPNWDPFKALFRLVNVNVNMSTTIIRNSQDGLAITDFDVRALLSSASIYVSDCWLDSNTGGGSPLGVGYTGGTIVVQRSNFTRNVLTTSTAYFAMQGTAVSDASLVLDSCIFSDQGTNSLTVVQMSPGVSGFNTVLTMNNCKFLRNTCGFSGVAGADITIRSGTLTNNLFQDNTGGGGGIRITAPAQQNSDPNNKWVMSGCIFRNNIALSSTGAGFSAYGLYDVRIMNSKFYNNTAYYSQGGAASIEGASSQNTRVTISSCVFDGNSAPEGGALALTRSNGGMTASNFTNNIAWQSGGAVSMDFSDFSVFLSKFDSNSVRPWLTINQLDPSIRFLGGCFNVISGSLSISTTSMSNCVVLPQSQKLEDCLNYASKAASLGDSVISDYMGGAIASSVGGVVISTSTFQNNTACGGSFLLQQAYGSIDLYMASVTVQNHSSFMGTMMMSSIGTLIMQNCVFQDLYAYNTASLMYASRIRTIQFSMSQIQRATAEFGDGGLFRISSIAMDWSAIIMEDVGAPTGGGALLFWDQVGNPAFQYCDRCNVTYTQEFEEAHRKSALYGPMFATDVASLTIQMNSSNSVDSRPTVLSLLPGDQFPTLTMTALDFFNQTVLGAQRKLVGQVTIGVRSNISSTIPLDPNGNPSASDIMATSDGFLFGNTLQAIDTRTGIATFSDLYLNANPGTFYLVFSMINRPLVASIVIRVEVSPTCPPDQHFDSVNLVCNNCADTALVWNGTSQECEACSTGLIGVARAGYPTECEPCPLGSTPNSRSGCGLCPLNYYTPLPGAVCESCQGDGLEGLTCVQDQRLAGVKPGYFALEYLRDDGSPALKTFVCPDNFCFGGLLQTAYSKTGSSYQNQSNQVGEGAGVITTTSQCTYPRLASNTNYLCGQCAEGLIEVADKCAECKSFNGGLFFSFLLLSFLLIILFLYSAAHPSPAGHVVIVLYFTQTAMLEIGSNSALNLTNWLNIALFSPTNLGVCFAPISVYNQVLLQLLIPVFMVVQMGFMGVVHAVLATNPSVMDRFASVCSQKLHQVVKRIVAAFSLDLYISATFSILLFCYTQVTVTCLRYLSCVEITSEVSVVFTQPTAHCNSREYHLYLIPVCLAIGCYIAAFPVGIFLLLWRNAKHRLYYHHRSEMDSRMDGVEGGEEVLRENTSNAVLSANPAAVVSASPRSSTNNGNNGDLESSPSTVAANVAGEQFCVRFSPLFAPFGERGWSWQVVLLVRRTFFVAVDVTLVRNLPVKFMSFTLLHLASLLLLLYVRPFAVQFYNNVDTVAHILLILMSLTLTAYTPPYSTYLNVWVFLLILPPLFIYIIVAIVRYTRLRRKRSREEIRLKIDLHIQREQRTFESISSPANKVPTASSAGTSPMSQLSALHAQQGSIRFRTPSTAPSPDQPPLPHSPKDEPNEVELDPPSRKQPGSQFSDVELMSVAPSDAEVEL